MVEPPKKMPNVGVEDLKCQINVLEFVVSTGAPMEPLMEPLFTKPQNQTKPATLVDEGDKDTFFFVHSEMVLMSKIFPCHQFATVELVVGPHVWGNPQGMPGMQLIFWLHKHPQHAP